MGWSIEDIPHLNGRVAIITGANQGLGFEAARALAGRGATVVLAVRTLKKGERAAEAIREEHATADVQLVHLDLSSLASIRDAARDVRARFERIDVLINNAGVMISPRDKTADGFEMQLGTNHLGHFAWTGQLLDRMLDVPGSRIVTHTSVGHRMAPEAGFGALDTEERLAAPAAYNRSKLANLMFHYELQRRLSASGAQTMAVAAHPGLSNTTLLNQPSARFLRPFMFWMTQSAEMGALGVLRAAVDPDVLGGQVYGPDGFQETTGHPVLVTTSARSYDTKEQRELWQASERLTGVAFPRVGETEATASAAVMRGGAAWTADDVPDQSGRVAVITGANQGLGLAAANVLAGRGATVVLAVRTPSKGEAAAETIRAQHPDADVRVQRLDLASLASVRTAAEDVRRDFERIDLLINNAGAMHAPTSKTEDGFGIQFGTNHLGHFAWTGLLIDRLVSVPGSRVVVHSSIAHTGVTEIDFDALPEEPSDDHGNLLNRLVFRDATTAQTNSAYGRSKLANLLFTYELQRRLTAAGAPTIAVAAHPGLTHTQLLHDIPGSQPLLPLMSMLTQGVDMGVLPILRAATDPGCLGGQYYGPGDRGGMTGAPVVTTSSDYSYDGRAQRSLWEVSERLTSTQFRIPASHATSAR